MQSFLTERIEETLSGYTAAVAVNVIGPDFDALDRAARDIARTLHRIRVRPTCSCRRCRARRSCRSG